HVEGGTGQHHLPGDRHLHPRPRDRRLVGLLPPDRPRPAAPEALEAVTATIVPAQSGSDGSTAPEGSTPSDAATPAADAAPALRFSERYLLATLLTFAALVFGIAARLRVL